MDPQERFRQDVISLASGAARLSRKDVEALLEKPPNPELGDLALPCFALAKKMRKPPQGIAGEVASRIKPSGLVSGAGAEGPYVNFFLDWEKFSGLVLKEVLRGRERYGSSKKGRGSAVVIDYSGPNTAKPMGIGHLRSTIIGQSIYNILSFSGYRCIGDNHLGDWGTQFGKLIYAYKKWGNRKLIEKNPVKEMFRLYVKFHNEAEKNPELDERGREEFSLLERGNKENIRLWRWLSETSLKDFKRFYKILGVKFDLYLGESFYLEMSRDVIKKAADKGISKKSEGALIIEVGKNMPPLVLQKSDESTLYSTRDLATIEYRIKKYRPALIVYVTGSEHRLYFEQVFIAAKKLGILKGKTECVHLPFGLISLPEGKMSTRKGRVILLDDVIDRAVKKILRLIEEKNPRLPKKKRVAEQVGLGAIKYADLSKDIIKDIRFDWDEILSFEGDTGPYLQYTHARACSILRKARKRPARYDASLLAEGSERALLRKLAEFPGEVSRASRDMRPHYIANYAYGLADLFNNFYQALPVLKAEERTREARLTLVTATKTVLRNALGLLGIEAPERM
jgi:arginyl-tRNA synthetase